MSKRLVLCGASAKLNVETVEPYIDVTFRIVNASVFSMIADKVEGNAFYRGYSGEKCYLSRTPIIVDSINVFTLLRATLGELTLRQFVPLEITDNIAANNDALKLDFSEVRVHFRFPGTGGHTEFCWFGDAVEVGGLAVSNQTLAKLGIIPAPRSDSQSRLYPRPFFTVQEVTADKPTDDPRISHKDKIRIVITNTLEREIEVWTPVWRSLDVHLQVPHASKLRLEGPKGWKAGDWGEEQQSTKVPVGLTFSCWIGLLPPVGASIQRRLQTRVPIGTAIFPVKINQKLYEIPIDL